MLFLSAHSLVVDDHASHVSELVVSFDGNWKKASIWVMEVQLRSPVVGKVVSDVAGQTTGRSGPFVVHSSGEAIPPGDDVNMAGYIPWVDDWIEALVEEATETLDLETGARRPNKRGSQAEEREVHDAKLDGTRRKIGVSLSGK